VSTIKNVADTVMPPPAPMERYGAIGVIASLVYLAGQIRHSREQMSQNTRALRAATYQQFCEEIFHAYNSPVAVHGLNQTIRSGMADFDQLDDVDALQFNFWAIGIMHSYDNAYYQYRVEMLDDDRWEIQRADLVGFVGLPGVV